MRNGRTFMVMIAGLAFGATLLSAEAQSLNWQRIQMPTAAAVAAVWNDPPSEYGPEPYYGMGGPITVDVIRRDLDTMKARGWRAVTAQYGAGSGFDYLSQEHLELVRQLVLEAKKRGMKIWLVDDAGYPSGFAGGKFSSEHPELRMQILTASKVIALAGGESIDEAVSADTVVVSAISSPSEKPVDIPAVETPAVEIPAVNGRAKWTAPAGHWKVMFISHAFRTSPTRSDTNPTRAKDETQSLEDYLNPDATQQYLAFTHKAYQRVIGDEFGKTVLGFRGDEPDYSVNGLPWTPRFFDTFRRMKGYDIRPYLAAFLQPGPVATLTARQLGAKADFYDVFSRMFEDGFFKPQAVWCAQNKMEYQVHLNHEELQLRLVKSEGDLFRALRYAQLPGVDAIWHQIWTDTVSDFPRLVSSVSHVYGHPRAFTESFAAYRPLPDLDMARYIINEQFVRGINLVETMYYPASSTTRGGPMPFMRNPGWPALMAYVRRVSYLLSMGRPAADVALLLPTASLWMQESDSDNAFVSSERLLSERQIDFDVVTEDAINETLKAGPGTLETASGNRYRTVIVPNAKVLLRATLEKLRNFTQSGGRVLFITGTPKYIAEKTYVDEVEADPSAFTWATLVPDVLTAVPTPPAFPKQAFPPPLNPPAGVVSALDAATGPRAAALETPDTALRLLQRRLKDANVLMVFNESGKPIANVLRHQLGRHVERWDAETGKVKVENAESGRIVLDLKPYETAFYVIKD